MNQHQEQHSNWVTLASIWAGGVISIPALMMGSTLIGGLGFVSSVFAGLLGISFVVFFMSLESIAAMINRMNTVQLAQSSFGKTGASLLIGTIIGLATMGWFGVQTNIAGISFTQIFAEVSGMEIPASVSSIFWGLVMLITAVYGVKFMKWLNYIAVPAIVLLIVYGLTVSFQQKGWSEIINYAPPASMNFWTAMGITIGFIAVGGVISPDINRFAKSRKDVLLGSCVGMILPGILLLSVGAMLGILQDTHDITAIFSGLGYPVMALSILILATWTTNVINAYSGGLAVNQLLQLDETKRPLSTLIAGGIGTLLAAFGILNHFISFLMILTTAIPPVAGVLIADFWIVRSFDSKTNQSFNWKGFVSWGLGVAGMILITDPIKNILSIFISAIAFWLLNKLSIK